MAGRVAHVALLRGINVGTAKRVAMADLKALVEELGHEDVRTLLNSGNVVFTRAASAKGDLAAQLEKALLARTGVTARVLTRTAAEFERAVAKNPLTRMAGNPSRHFVAFLRTPLEQNKLKPLLAAGWGADRLAAGPGVAYLWCPDGFLDSPLARAFERALGDGFTARNWATVQKVAALLEAVPKRP
jgi:uncharacterized protein (DUF1697 family)